jgi:hypothetical protein
MAPANGTAESFPIPGNRDGPTHVDEAADTRGTRA